MYRLPPRPSPSARRKAPTWNLRLPSSTTVPRHTRAISSSLPTSPRGAPPARSKYQARGCPHAQGYLPFKSASPSVNGCSDLDARHLGHAELARRQHAAVAGDDAVLAVDQYWVGEPKLGDACGIWEPYFYGTGKSRAITLGLADLKGSRCPRRPIHPRSSR